MEAHRSPRRCAVLCATCQSAGRAARALFSSGIFCGSQPSCFIRLLELLQAAGKMSSLGCFLSRTERVPNVQLPAGCSPRLTPLSGGNKEAISFQTFVCSNPRASLWKCRGGCFTESGGPALSHGFGAPPGCASPALGLI